MSLRFRSKQELTGQRLMAALRRRISAIPHHLAWAMMGRGPSSETARVATFHQVHRGHRCFIIGNGPSLADMDLQYLRDEITFGLNRIYLNFARMDFIPTYLVCMNELVLDQSATEISDQSMPRFINWNRRHLFNHRENIFFLHEVYRPHFSLDASRKIWGGATVTFAAMQLAYFTGVEEVILIGVDHSFSAEGTPHQTITSLGGDKDHFDESYFPKGFRWQLPDLQTSEFAYQLAREAFEYDGRRILDATVDGKLTIFPKVDFRDLF